MPKINYPVSESTPATENCTTLLPLLARPSAGSSIWRGPHPHPHSGTWRWTSRDLSHIAFRQVALMLISSSPEVSYRTTRGISDLSSISTAKIFPHVNDSTTFTRSGSSFRISNPGQKQQLSFLLSHRSIVDGQLHCLFWLLIMVYFLTEASFHNNSLPYTSVDEGHEVNVSLRDTLEQVLLT